MPSIRSITGALALALLSQQSAAQTAYPANCTTCVSYGVDFQENGIYFQNSNSDNDFTFNSQYDDCQPDYANNVLVDPSGTQYLCSQTALNPDNTTQTSTCSIEKSALVSGQWTIIAFSNNGKCAPFNAQRNFLLDVGPQATTTLTPGVTFVSTSTPVKVATTVSTSTITYYLPTSTVTLSKSVKNPTRTASPSTTIRVTTTLSTKTLTRYNLVATAKLVKTTAKCQTSVATSPDPTATITVTVAPSDYSSDSSDGSAQATAIKARQPAHVNVIGDLAGFLQKRADKLEDAVVKRDVDQPTSYVVLTDITTSTSTVYASTVTFTTTSLVSASTTVTPLAATLYLNPITTVTLPTSTITKTRTISVTTTWVTATRYSTVRVTTTITPTAKASACSATGGYMQ